MTMNNQTTETLFSDDINVVLKLLQEKHDVNIKDKEGNTPLIIAASKGNTTIVTSLLQAGANVNQKNEFGSTAIMLAAKNGYTETVKSLILFNADLNVEDNEFGIIYPSCTALIYATMNNHMITAQTLINAGANVHAKNKDEQTVLMFAAQAGYAEMVEMYIRMG